MFGRIVCMDELQLTKWNPVRDINDIFKVCKTEEKLFFVIFVLGLFFFLTLLLSLSLSLSVMCYVCSVCVLCAASFVYFNDLYCILYIALYYGFLLCMLTVDQASS